MAEHSSVGQMSLTAKFLNCASVARTMKSPSKDVRNNRCRGNYRLKAVSRTNSGVFEPPIRIFAEQPVNRAGRRFIF